MIYLKKFTLIRVTEITYYLIKSIIKSYLLIDFEYI